MVWVYDSPLTANERKVYDVLKRKLKEQDIAKTTIKILSLYAFLKSQKFSSPKELRESAFLDKEKVNQDYHSIQLLTVGLPLILLLLFALAFIFWRKKTYAR